MRNPEQKESEKVIHVSNASDLGRRGILVVEDDRTHRTLMEKILKECGFLTYTAENGLIALSKLDSGARYDLIIMDWDMPELNGLEATREIRARQARGEFHHIPIIAFTSHKRPGDREQCLASGMDAYLPKDVWLPKWRQTLMDSLQGLIAGDFNVADFEGNYAASEAKAPEEAEEYDLESFDEEALSQAESLLKNELPIAIEEYLEDAAAYIRDIKEGIEAANAEKVARGSHPLKSNSRGFGLTSVSHLAEAINTRARNVLEGKESLKAVEPLFPKLQEAFYKAEKRLREVLKRDAGQ